MRIPLRPPHYPYTTLFRPDPTTSILHVQAGAIWADILPYLNERGLSVGVMQSNDSFSVGGSMSANCHGWQTGKPPICSTDRTSTRLNASHLGIPHAVHRLK